jgi:hypothetical protein
MSKGKGEGYSSKLRLNLAAGFDRLSQLLQRSRRFSSCNALAGDGEGEEQNDGCGVGEDKNFAAGFDKLSQVIP